MSKINVKSRVRCRICGSSSLNKWLTFKNSPLTDNIKKSNVGAEFLHDIDIYTCNKCHISQTLHDISYGRYYNDYNYSVNTSETAAGFMKKLCEKLWSNYSFKEGSKVVEIGSSDGSQLKYFKDKGADVLGIEPSEILCKLSEDKGVKAYHGLFDENIKNNISEKYQSADLIILEYTLDHLPDPLGSLKILQSMIDKNGLIVAEVHNLRKIIERKEYCLFEHEHTIYLSEETIKSLFDKAGLKIVNFDILDDSEKRANSLLVVAKNKDEADKFIKDDSNFIYDESTYSNFQNELQLSIKRIGEFIDENSANGKKVAGFGAGGRGVMILSEVENANKLAYMCDNNAMMQGLYTPKTHLPIVNPLHLKEEHIDTLIVFSFGYIDEIKKQVSMIIDYDVKIVSILDLIK